MFDRRLRLEAAAAKVREIPQPYRASLAGPTAVRKVFHKQDDALRFAQHFGPEMMIFSYESHSLGQEGQRFFLASGVQSFFHYYRQMNSSMRSHYEVIPTFRPAKLYLDLEFSTLSNPNKDGAEAAKIFIKALCAVLEYFFKIKMDSEQILVLDASTEKKFSQHVVFNSPKTVFENNLEQGQLIRLLCSALWLLSSSGSTTDELPVRIQCSSCFASVHHLASTILPAAGITPMDANRCLVYPPVPSTDECPSSLVSICDMGVYTRNRNFRLAGSHKLTGTSVLWPVGASKTGAIDFVWANWKDWAQTLVTFFCEPSESERLRRPVADCSCSPTVCNNQSSFRAATFVVKPTATAPCEPLHLPNDLHQFVQMVLTFWFQKDPRYAACGRIEHAQPTRWKMHGFDELHFTVTADGLRFCERLGRAHRSNHVILVFDLCQGCYYQKCFDPDCRALDFRSQRWPIPRKLCQQSQSNDESPHPNRDNESFSEPSITDDDLMLCGVMDTMNVPFYEDF